MRLIPPFKSLEFEGLKHEAGRNSFYLSAKTWIEARGAIGLHAKSGRYGGTYTHRDIAFEFACSLSHEFKLQLINPQLPGNLRDVASWSNWSCCPTWRASTPS